MVLSRLRPAARPATAFLLVLLAIAASGQSPTQSTAVTPASGPPPATSGKLTAKEARDAKIAADAEKLYQMALDLKIEVDKSNKDTVSLSIVKKAADLEKLAKILKQEMREN